MEPYNEIRLPLTDDGFNHCRIVALFSTSMHLKFDSGRLQVSFFSILAESGQPIHEKSHSRRNEYYSMPLEYKLWKYLSPIYSHQTFSTAEMKMKDTHIETLSC